MKPIAVDARPLSADRDAVPYSALIPPNGEAGIIATFGDIQKYIAADGTLNPQWQVDMLGYAGLPYPLMLSFDHALKITHFRCHNLLVEVFEQTFREIVEQGFGEYLCSFGGCFTFRPQRRGSKLSAHSWGIAIDLNPETNAQGTSGDMNPGIISIFQRNGFEWGGTWIGKHRDPMHFQYCSGY
jgi:hypothetical protein